MLLRKLLFCSCAGRCNSVSVCPFCMCLLMVGEVSSVSLCVVLYSEPSNHRYRLGVLKRCTRENDRCERLQLKYDLFWDDES
jgi:hypothetical protein